MEDANGLYTNSEMNGHDQEDDNFLLPPPPKRRLITKTDGRLMVAVSASPGTSTAGSNIDLENCSLSEQERREFGLLSKCDDGEGETTSSLDESLVSLRNSNPYETGIEMADRLEAMYELYRQDILDGEMFATPLFVLNKMAQEFGLKLHFEYHEIRPHAEPIRILAEVYVGKRKGYGEAATKKLAAHMASAHLLLQLEGTGKYTIPPYYLLPGCRIHPRIFGDLTALCDLLGVERPMFVLQPKDPEEKDGPLFTIKCQIGGMITIGESDSVYLARRWAAKFAFEGLTGFPVPFDFVCCGQACMALVHAKIKPVVSKKVKKIGGNGKLAYVIRRKLGRAPANNGSGIDSATSDVASNVDDNAIDEDIGNATDPVDEDLDNAFAENDEHIVEREADEDTRERMNVVIQSMTEEVKERLSTLGIGDGQESVNEEKSVVPDNRATEGGDAKSEKNETREDNSGQSNKSNKDVWRNSDDWDWGD